MTEKIYNETVKYCVINHEDSGECDELIISTGTKNDSEFVEEYFMYFGKNNPCRYISMLGYMIYHDFLDLYRYRGREVGYYDIFRMIIVFFSEREATDKPSNISLGEDNILYLTNESAIGIDADLKFLRECFDYWRWHGKGVRKYFVNPVGETIGINLY